MKTFKEKFIADLEALTEFLVGPEIQTITTKKGKTYKRTKADETKKNNLNYKKNKRNRRKGK